MEIGFPKARLSQVCMHRFVSDRIKKWESENKQWILLTEMSYKKEYDKIVFRLTDQTVKVFYRPKP